MPSPEVSPTVGGAKFANTILRVYLPPQEDSLPLRLRSCMTISFSSNTLLEHLIQIEKVAALRVTFEGKSDGAEIRSGHDLAIIGYLP